MNIKGDILPARTIQAERWESALESAYTLINKVNEMSLFMKAIIKLLWMNFYGEFKLLNFILTGA